MSHGRKIMEGAGGAYELSSGPAAEAIGRAVRSLSAVESYDPALSSFDGPAL